jgi:hypothetical protein
MVDEHETQVRAWLEVEPSLSAQAILDRLIEAAPARFTGKQLRTIQRAVKAYRGEIAHRLILDGFTPHAATASAPKPLDAGCRTRPA